VAISVFDLFSVGIGPSSSHTVGPMRAAVMFVDRLRSSGLLPHTDRVHVELFGSLGATGYGHGSPKAVLLGLEGNQPELVDPPTAALRVEEILATGRLRLGGTVEISFHSDVDLVMHRRKSLPLHPNGMSFEAFDGESSLDSAVYYSVGGGFVVDETASGTDRIKQDETQLPHPFLTGDDLLARTRETGLSISEIMLANEQAWRSEEKIRSGLLHIWQVMQECVEQGCSSEQGELPGGLKVRRRAADMRRRLEGEHFATDPLRVMDWVTLFALAVNEENAAGGRVVTAPTNGAAGIVPAVLHYYTRFVPGASDDGVVRFLLTAGAIGVLFKENASISGAEVGCQGEVGSACSMAAGGLAEVLGGTPEQVENAAEIAMEHNLGLTCDPIGGLVQIPCIERNAISAGKAINAARMALRGDGTHRVSLDEVIETMRSTGRDMSSRYKETSTGGLAINVAVNFVEC
jgi:L-serine dehydratase